MQIAKKGFSLVEMCTTVALMGILSLILVSSFSSFKETSREKAATQSLALVKSAQLLTYSSRGNWALTEGAVAGLSVQGLSISASPSTRSTQVSVHEVLTGSGSDAVTALSMSIMVTADRCFSLLVYPPDRDTTSVISKRKLAANETCGGS